MHDHHIYSQEHSIKLDPSAQLTGYTNRIKEYLPLILIIGFSLIFAVLHSSSTSLKLMSLFMGYFFCLLSMFKLFDLKGFVDGFESYDLVTKLSRTYGYFYPFIELLLGVCYLTGLNAVTTYYMTLVIMLVGAVGVIKNILSGSKIKCACLGTALNVPLTYISVIENIGMAIMALSMLLLY